MALQEVEADLPLSLDDFIPPHLQKKHRPLHNDAPRQVTLDNNDQAYKATLVFMSEDTDEAPLGSPSPQIQRRWICYDGIGPTDEDGMPYASRSSVDKPREWYRNMFRVLHRLSDSEDSDSEGSRQAGDKTRIHNVKETSGCVNKQQELEEKPERSPETSQLHITIKSKVRESPSKSSAISKVQTSPGPSYMLSHSTGPSSLSLNKPGSLAITSEGPNLTSSFTSTHSSTTSSSKTPLQTEVNSSYRYQKTQEPASSYSPSSSISYTSQPRDLPYIAPRLAHKEISSPKSPNGKEKYSSFIANSSDTCTKSPTRRSTTKMLDQLETDLLQFTEELDRDLKVQKQRTENLQFCEEVVSQRSSHREADVTPEPTLNSHNSRSNTEDYQALPPVAQAVVKFDFVAQSEKELSLQHGRRVNILKKVDQNWLLGEQDGRRGLFPESYVKVVSPGQCEAADTPQLSAIALYDFKADSDAEIPLRKVSTGFTLKEKPCIVKAPASSKLHQLQGTLYQARFNFCPNNPDELQLQVGDVVTVTEHCDDGWHVGACWRTQQFGTFPGNYVVPYETT